MNLSTLDWSFIFGFFAISLVVGLYASKKASKNSTEFFLSGRNMPWWLLGISMVATTFSADTPNLVTDIVRKDGVSGNWVWWAFLLTGMLTVFVYARLWRRSNVLTDLEFYELRYGGKEAAFLRGFRALYLGIVFNVVVMATVCLAAIKIGATLLGLDPYTTLLIASVVTVLYSVFGGLRGIIYTDFFQFILAMIGTIWAACIIVNLPEIGGLDSLLAHENVSGKLNILPDFSDTKTLIPLLIVPLAVQWWASYYPGAEPGGGGYVAQRMLAAKDEKNAMGATLFFNIAHYAMRPWPWILIALASLLVFPMDISGIKTHQISDEAVQILNEKVTAEDIALLEEGILFWNNKTTDAHYTELAQQVAENPERVEIKSLAYLYQHKNSAYQDEKSNSYQDKETLTNPIDVEQLISLQLANPTVPLDKIGHDIAYPTMLQFLPSGLLGLVLASLIGAFMSTISTHLNWGASYLANDFYKRFVNPQATEKDLITWGRIATVALMLLAALLALELESALDAFNIILLIGAGTGLIFILRWFWWRINAYSEISAMLISFVVALVFKFGDFGLESYMELLIGVLITTMGWLAVTFITKPTQSDVLVNFYKKIKPAKWGWEPVLESALAQGEMKKEELEQGQLPLELLCVVIGCFTVYGALFAVGYLIYGNGMSAAIASVITILGAVFLFRTWAKLNKIES